MGTRSKSKQKLGTHVRHSVQVFLTFKHFFQLSVNSQFVLCSILLNNCNEAIFYYYNIIKLLIEHFDNMIHTVVFQCEQCKECEYAFSKCILDSPANKL